MTAEAWPNVVTMFFDQAERFGSKPFLSTKVDGEWCAQSWASVAERVAKLAGGLRALGVKPGDRVAIVSENRPEWLIADHAIMAAGAISVPVYTTYTSRDYLHVFENSGACAVILSNDKLAKQVLPAAHESLALKFAICMEPPHIHQSINCDIHLWDDVLSRSTTSVAEVREWARSFKREDLACLIYTSGTGGAPRGVMQHHGGLLHNCAGAREVIAVAGIGNDVFLSFLPLSHAYEHTGGQFFPISLGAQIFYAEGFDKLAANLEEARPTVVVVVPRLFEVLRSRILRGIEAKGGIAERLFHQALALGQKKQRGAPGLGAWEKILDLVLEFLVRRKLRRRVGGRVKAMVSGGAPLNPEIGDFFTALGITLLQGYGQTEAHPIIAVNPLDNPKSDTVGPPLRDTEVKIAEDGEILVRGELVMRGYWQDPQGTAETIRDGWLHTGDVGLIDEDGHIKITDRKKDIIVNDKGDNVSPQRIEGLLSLEMEIAQAMVHGDRRPYLVGLIVPDSEWLERWKKQSGKEGNLADLTDDKELHAAIDQAVARVNKRLANLERLRRFILAPEPFTVANEQMTPTLKIRRHVIREKYGAMLDALYGRKGD